MEVFCINLLLGVVRGNFPKGSALMRATNMKVLLGEGAQGRESVAMALQSMSGRAEFACGSNVWGGIGVIS